MTTLQNSLFSLAIALFLLFSPVANAQDNSTIAVGGGITYGEKLEEIGLQLNGYYKLTDQIRVGGDFIYWLVDSPQGVSNTYFEPKLSDF